MAAKFFFCRVSQPECYDGAEMYSCIQQFFYHYLCDFGKSSQDYFTDFGQSQTDAKEKPEFPEKNT